MQHPNNYFTDFRGLAKLLEAGTVFTAFDTETTGLTPADCRLTEIGAVQFDKTGILRTYNVLINPQIPIPLMIQNITHITDELVVDCPSSKDVLPEFIDFIGKTMLIAHNAGFDLCFVDAELERAGMKSVSNKTIDTLTLTRWAYPMLKTHKLQTLAEAMKINVLNAHRAQDDARVCMEVFLRTITDTASVQK